MPRKTTGERLLRLDGKFGKILFPAKFNETTIKLEPYLNKNLAAVFLSKRTRERAMFENIQLSMKYSSTNPSLLFFFNEGTETIKNVFLNTRTNYLNNKDELPDELSDELSDDAIDQTITDLVYVFSTEQPWYLTYLYKKPLSIKTSKTNLEYFDYLNNTCSQPINNFYLVISTEVHRKRIKELYTPAVLIKLVVETCFTPSELSEFRKDNNKLYPVMDKIDQELLKELRTYLGCTTNQIPEPFCINIKNLGLKLAIKNFEYSVPISSVTTLGMSEIFKSMPLSPKIVKFLHDNNASLSVIELYEELQKNPCLFFDLKKLAASVNQQTLLKLEAFIRVFNEAFILTPTSTSFTAQEQKLMQNQYAFLYVDTTNPEIQKTRIDTHSSLSELSEYVFPLNNLAINLTPLQLQNILLFGFLVFKNSDDYLYFHKAQFNNFTTYRNMEITSETFNSFLNSFTNYKDLYESLLRKDRIKKHRFNYI